MRYKNVFITGASRGVGKSLAEYYSKRCVNLGLVCRENINKIIESKDYYSSNGSFPVEYKSDVTDAGSIKRAIEDFTSRFGVIDLLIVNAGIADVCVQRPWDSKVAISNIDTNYLGAINTISPCIDDMIKANHGSIAIISSISALRATFNSGAYSASKAAISKWSEGLRLSLHQTSIKVIDIKLGFVRTDMTSSNKFWMPFIIESNKAAELIARKIYKGSRSCVVPISSGGLWLALSLLPQSLYEYLIIVAGRLLRK